LQNFSLDSKRDAPINIDGSDLFVFIAKVKLDPQNLDYKKIILRSIPKFEDLHDTILNTIAAHTSIQTLNVNQTLEPKLEPNEDLFVYHGKLRVKMRDLQVNKSGLVKYIEIKKRKHFCDSNAMKIVGCRQDTVLLRMEPYFAMAFGKNQDLGEYENK
jgi:hypothetical protein